MKRGISIISATLLMASMGLLARHAYGGEPQTGGLPALEDRVEADEALIIKLQLKIADLRGQNNWAVVSADGDVVRSKPAVGVTVEHAANSGVYEVVFTKNVSGCAYEATIGGSAAGLISVSGDTDADNPNDVNVHTFTAGGTPQDSPFHLYVSCL
jgi:hypothetical protein